MRVASIISIKRTSRFPKMLSYYFNACVQYILCLYTLYYSMTVTFQILAVLLHQQFSDIVYDWPCDTDFLVNGGNFSSSCHKQKDLPAALTVCFGLKKT